MNCKNAISISIFLCKETSLALYIRYAGSQNVPIVLLHIFFISVVLLVIGLFKLVITCYKNRHTGTQIARWDI